MKKRLASVFLLPPALAAADVRFYGELKSGVEISRAHFGGQTALDTRVADFGSHIGLRGSYPIGGGSLIWQAEQHTPVGKTGGYYGRRYKRNADSGGRIGLSLP